MVRSTLAFWHGRCNEWGRYSAALSFIPPTGFRRWLDVFVALPDRLRMPLAVVGALLVHGFLVLIVWLAPYLAPLLNVFLPASCTAKVTPPQAKPAPLEIV